MAEAIVDWTDPNHDRRRPMPGRRARDYDTCHFHDNQCERVAALETRMVGWRVFNLIIGGLGAAILFIGGLTWSINVKVDSLVTQINTLSVEVAKLSAASAKK